MLQFIMWSNGWGGCAGCFAHPCFTLGCVVILVLHPSFPYIVTFQLLNAQEGVRVSRNRRLRINSVILVFEAFVFRPRSYRAIFLFLSGVELSSCHVRLERILRINPGFEPGGVKKNVRDAEC
uniref:Uncharacterized protein n=1 Tax=Pinguiococcus pyrenoidosus TaxID=172671 RepID=A0A7R9U0Y6_9STRA